MSSTDEDTIAPESPERQQLVAEVERARDAIASSKDDLSSARDDLAAALARAREAGVPMKVLMPASGLARAMIHRSIVERARRTG